MEHLYDMIIIGGGPGGYTAALYSARAGLRTLVLERLAAGGQMTQTTQIDNYPGIPGIDGYALGQQMREGAEQFGAETLLAQVQYADLKASPKRVETDRGTLYAKTVVLATGADHRHLGLPRERDFVGRGLGYCAACDGMFYRKKTVAVVGGGNSAVTDALVLSRICKKVILLHRRDSLRATKIYHDQLEKAENIEIRWNTRVTALEGEDRLTGLTLDADGQEAHLSVDGVFISIGRTPVTDLFRGQVDLDEGGYIRAGESTDTNLPGVYAVGDVRTKEVRQIVTAAADGAVAAYRAEGWLGLENR